MESVLGTWHVCLGREAELRGTMRRCAQWLILLRVGLSIVIVGLWMLARAGRMRERDQTSLQSDKALLLPVNEAPVTKQAPKPSFMVGLVVCLLSGVFSCMLNLAVAFGEYVIGRGGELPVLQYYSPLVSCAQAVLLMRPRIKVPAKCLRPTPHGHSPWAAVVSPT